MENKYIFIDAFATWCGPCKMMDRTVYPNDTVGTFFNDKFISIKVQMDKTDHDNAFVQSWYRDADSISKKYMVEGYPTFIFLSPEGTIVHKDLGYKTVDGLITLGQTATTRGKVYDDPYKEYARLVADYKNGIKHYNRMPYMINTALKFADADLAKQLAKDYVDYASGLNENERYTKENIQLWASFDLGLQSKAFHLFYKDRDKIDQVMNEKGYSQNIVDNTIQKRIVDSFFRMQKGETTIITGEKVLNSEIMFMRLPVRKDGRIQPDFVEADWNRLKKMIRKKFNTEYAKRNVLTARMRWYHQHQNIIAALKIKFLQLEKFPPAVFDNGTALSINSAAWPAFLHVTDRKLLKKATQWMAKAVQQKPDDDALLDTYANLLYKTGRTQEAIQWEEKALSITNPIDTGQRKIYMNVIEKIKRGEPTYLEEGAIWRKK